MPQSRSVGLRTAAKKVFGRVKAPVFFDPHGQVTTIKMPELQDAVHLRERRDRKTKLVALLPGIDLERDLRKPHAPINRANAKKASILQLMKHLEAGRFSKGTITQTPQGFVIDREKLSRRLRRYLNSRAYEVQPTPDYTRANHERVKIIRQLASLGFKVVVPRYADLGETEPKSVYPHLKGVARTFKPLKMIRYNISYEGDRHPGKHSLPKTTVPPNNYWARDMYKKFGKERIRYHPTEYLSIGEGGLSVDISPNALFASSELKNDFYLEQAAELGHKPYFLEEKGNRYRSLLSRAFKAKVFTKTNHIDFFIGVAGRNIVVDPVFFKANQEMIERAAQEQHLKIIQIPTSETTFQPANFLVLGPNEILMERRAIKTRHALEQAGVKVHATVVPLKANLELGGGVRCMVNEV